MDVMPYARNTNLSIDQIPHTNAPAKQSMSFYHGLQDFEMEHAAHRPPDGLPSEAYV